MTGFLDCLLRRANSEVIAVAATITAIVAPIASTGSRKYDIEVRGYNSKVGLLPMILIPRNRADQLGWLKAVEAVIGESQRRTHWKKRRKRSESS